MAKGDKRPVRWWGLVVAVVAGVLASAGVKELIKRGQLNSERDKQAAAWGLDRKATDRITEMTEREMQSVFASPLFRKRVEQEKAAGTDPKGLGRTLVSRGLPRLSDDDLAALHSLRKRMILASERACPCFWDPAACTEADIMDGLSRLTDLELAAWSKLSAKAGLAELSASAPVPSTENDFARGLAAVHERLPEAERGRLDRIFETKGAPPKAEQCFAMRTILSGAETLPPDERAKFIRALVNVGAKN
jgi:hypothetical protein